ncbi:MAG: deoxynucleoside kinase [Firmicutes bacterium]|nr:deoxynucleoside kinase [Bacillota bacterium]
MSFIVSIQGGMAVGKTTLAIRLKERLNDVQVSFENPSNAIQRVKELGLDKFKENDFIRIQRIFINSEIERFKNLKEYDKVIIDLGPEEIEFYTLFFPKSIGQNWNIEDALAKELKELRECRLDGILFLDASPEVLLARKESDETRKRGFFDYYIKNLHPYKKGWFERFEYTSILNVDKMSIEETEDYTVKWLKEIES